MIELLKVLNKQFDSHFIRYGEMVEGDIDNPIEVRVRSGEYWAMTYFPAENVGESGLRNSLVKTLEDIIREEKAND